MVTGVRGVILTLTCLSRGAFNFSQSIIPLLLASTKSTNTTASSPSEIRYPPTLIFTGATASTKASANFSNFTPGKFALRSLSQSIAKEFGPQGIHVGHAIIDGVIDTELTKNWMVGAGPDAKINPEGVRMYVFSFIDQEADYKPL